MTPSSFPELSWPPAGGWDVDVAVVGAGPAGLAAAVRLRWQKTHPAVPVSVALVNSGPAGGLAALGNSILTGPSLAFPSGGLVERLTADLARWPAPRIAARVTALHRRRGTWRLRLEDGRVLRALSVILATGMMDLRNLADFWERGVTATFGSRRLVFARLEEHLSRARAPVVLGSMEVSRLWPRLRAMNPRTRLFVPAAGEDPPEAGGLPLHAGRLAGLEGGGRVSGLCYRDAEGRVQVLETDLVVVEFNSLECRRADRLPGQPAGPAGFVRADSRGRTRRPGLFAAGDCTGPPFSAAVALGQGIEAAFSAYRYVCRAKYGAEPPLFAYFGDPDLPAGPDDPFRPRPELVPLPLLRQCPEPGAAAAWALMDGRRTLSQIGEEAGLAWPEVEDLAARLIRLRAVTYLPFTGRT
ncbi:NAD(P)/FAD-dependent oxidoreductase [Dissulfurirhabdus thermomarina]|uniref:NAD(P)/FAD-dependent oxidoreductase n=1 Tax=Dissulfurirhabdus thermomarina TaxID=1765737 RepID=A0A6N9TME8_DISTH|nr:NAD(P)/FAD-dependent oxidoreductase [Dissulfurirhabdus thermomarina]NDY42299.1 NAD(P)/FAD-dependent oxidoreductase [Dissulfurirhabdus thermomarina]NMX24158.1 NAD(P)/FAD-dependent oxidoreductase [Dissulfurirhabdus thermomarina]